MQSDHNPHLKPLVIPENEDIYNAQLKRLEACNSPNIAPSTLRHAATLICHALTSEGGSYAKSTLELAAQLCVLDSRALLMLGVLYSNEQKHSEAINCYSQYIDRYTASKNIDDYKNNLAACYFYRGNSFYSLGDFVSAKRDYRTGVKLDKNGEATSALAKKRIAQNIHKIHLSEFKQRGMVLTPEHNHANLVKASLLEKNFNKSLIHLEQAVLLDPSAGYLHHYISQTLRVMPTAPDDEIRLEESVAECFYASWLIRSGIDTISPLDPEQLYEEATQLQHKLDTLITDNNLRQLALTIEAKKVELANAIKAEKTMALVVNTVKMLLSDLTDSDAIQSIATALHCLYQDQIQKITKAECKKILALLKTPEEIAPEAINLLYHSLNRFNDIASYREILHELDKAIATYPRSSALYLERAKYRMLQPADYVHPDKTEEDLQSALWLHCSQLDRHQFDFAALYSHYRSHCLSIDETAESLKYHQKLLAMTPKEFVQAANMEYVGIIDDILVCNPEMEIETPETALSLLKLSYIVIPTPETKARLIEMKIRAALDIAKNKKLALEDEINDRSTSKQTKLDAKKQKKQERRANRKSAEAVNDSSASASAASAASAQANTESQFDDAAVSVLNISASNNAATDSTSATKQTPLTKQEKLAVLKEMKLKRRAERKALEAAQAKGDLSSDASLSNAPLIVATPAADSQSASTAFHPFSRTASPANFETAENAVAQTDIPSSLAADWDKTSSQDTPISNENIIEISADDRRETRTESQIDPTKAPSLDTIASEEAYYSETPPSLSREPLAQEWEELYTEGDNTTHAPYNHPVCIPPLAGKTPEDAHTSLASPNAAVSTAIEAAAPHSSLTDEAKQHVLSDLVISIPDSALSPPIALVQSSKTARVDHTVTEPKTAPHYSSEDLESHLIYQIQHQRRELASNQEQLQKQRQTLQEKDAALYAAQQQISAAQNQILQMQHLIELQTRHIAQLQNDSVVDKTLIQQNAQMQLMAIQSLALMGSPPPPMAAPAPYMQPLLPQQYSPAPYLNSVQPMRFGQNRHRFMQSPQSGAPSPFGGHQNRSATPGYK
jgi:tetratricopeptide (TPR) repeat protein